MIKTEETKENEEKAKGREKKIGGTRERTNKKGQKVQNTSCAD